MSASLSIDALKAHKDAPSAYTDVMKDMSVTHGGMVARGTSALIDPYIRKKVYRVFDGGEGGGASRVGITLPAASGTSTTTLRAKGRYAYLLYRPVANPDRRTARRQPWAHLTFSLDVSTKVDYVYRLSFSTEYTTPGELQMGRIAHIPLPQ